MGKVERKAQKQANEAEKGRLAAAAAERLEAEAWRDGTDARGERRKAEAEAKAAEKDRQKAELRRLQEEEEAAASGAKATVKKGPRQKKSDDIKELEAQLKAMEMEKKKKAEEKKKKAAALRRQSRATDEDDEDDDDYETSSAVPLVPLERNTNRMDTDVEIATGIDQALDLLASTGGRGGSGGAADRNPERRLKAAYKAYEERMMPQIKEEYPGLKLSQYKERIWESWQKSPENPLNQAKAAGAGGRGATDEV